MIFVRSVVAATLLTLLVPESVRQCTSQLGKNSESVPYPGACDDRAQAVKAQLLAGDAAAALRAAKEARHGDDAKCDKAGGS